MAYPFKLTQPITVDLEATATFAANSPALTKVNCSILDPTEGISETKKIVPASEKWIISAIYTKGAPTADAYVSIVINGIEQPFNLKLSETDITIQNPSRLPQIITLMPNDSFVIVARNVSNIGASAVTQGFKVRIVRMPAK